MVVNNCKENNVDSENIKPTSILRLTLLGICVITPAITPGMSMGYPAVALPQLNLTLDETSWFASIGSIATPFGNFLTGIIIDRYGRKPALILSILPSIFGWSVIAFGRSLGYLYLGRIFTGFALGAASLPSSIYAAECITINNYNLRGSLTTWTTLALSSGTLIVYILGSILRYDTVAAVSAFLSAVSLLLIVFCIPESPAWLYQKGRPAGAVRSQKSLGIYQPLLSRSSTSIADDSSKKHKSYKSISAGPDESDRFSFRLALAYIGKLRRKDIYKPLLITVAFLVCLQFSGVYVLTAYMVNIIGDAEKIAQISFPSCYFLTVIAGFIQFCAIVLITFIVPYSGIRKLSMISCAGVSVGMFLLATSSTVRSDNYDIVFAFRVFFIWLTVFMASLGFTVLPFSILGEVFPSDAASFASISLIVSSILNFISLKLYPYLCLLLSQRVFYIYSLASLFGFFFVFLFLPETVGKSLQEILDEFTKTPKCTPTNDLSENATEKQLLC